MTKASEAPSKNHPELHRAKCLEPAQYSSGVLFKASAIAPRDIIDALPEELLRWLHEDLDRKTMPRLPSRRVSQIDFESIIVDRLFPLRDEREFIARLRRHCHATATAAGMLAELRRRSTKLATVCGWLHDMGVASCIRHADEMSPITDDATLEVMWPTIARSSAQHGIRLASRWRLPSAIRHAIREHESFVTVGSVNPIVAITVVAEHVAAIVGCGFHDQAPVAVIDRAMAILQITDSDVMNLAARTDKARRHTRLTTPSSHARWGA